MTTFDDTTHPPKRAGYYLTVGPRKPRADGRGRHAYGVHHISTPIDEDNLEALCGTGEPQASRRGPLDAAGALHEMVATPGQWRCDTCWDEIIREKHPSLRRSSL